MSEEEIYEMIHQEMSNHYFDMHRGQYQKTMRFTAACAAMQGLLANSALNFNIDGCIRDSVKIADELLKELEK